MVQQGETAVLGCEAGRIIIVTSAVYGFGTNPVMCYDNNAMSKVERLCNGKPECAVSANDTVFLNSTCSASTPETLSLNYICTEGELRNVELNENHY